MWYITKPSDMEELKADIAVKNPCVLQQLGQDPEKRAFFLFQAGVAYSLYSDMDSSKMYSKRKLLKKQCLTYFDLSSQIKNSDALTWFYQALTLLELGKIQEANWTLRECMTNPGINGEKNELCVSLWALMMANDGQEKNALKLLKYSIKNYIKFTPFSQLVKSLIECKIHLQT